MINARACGTSFRLLRLAAAVGAFHGPHMPCIVDCRVYENSPNNAPSHETPSLPIRLDTHFHQNLRTNLDLRPPVVHEAIAWREKAGTPPPTAMC